MKIFRTIFAIIAFMAAFATGFAVIEEYEAPPINYSETEPDDPVALLKARLDSGELTLDASTEEAYLRSLLAELGVPEESQVLVYSKTSLQNDHISPDRPRAIYFNEDYYIGWVQGGDIEIISVDPDLGPVFYQMIPSRPKIREDGYTRADLFRSRDCLSCHGGSRTDYYPGMLVRSVHADKDGFPLHGAGGFVTDHTSPLKERWGGWYVTGGNDGDRHMGNLLYERAGENTAEVTEDRGDQIASLEGVIDTGPYLTPRSDIVALMVLEHQVTVHNAITQANMAVRKALHLNSEMAKHLDRDPNQLSGSTRRIIDSVVEDLLEAMLFGGEFPLKGWGIEGSEGFQKAFTADAPRDANGRSLKDFHLLSRLFKQRLSYMIYSRAFDGLPEEAKTVFYRKLHSILNGTHDDPEEKFAHIKRRERQRILSILRETKEDLPPYYFASD